MLVCLQLDLGLAIRGPHPRPLHVDTTSTERHLATLMAMTHRRPLGVVLAPRAHHIVDLLLHQLGQHAELDTDAQRKQPLLRCPDQLPQRLLHALREHGLITGRLSDRYVATHGGSSLDLCGITANAPNRSGRGRRDRRHLTFLRAPGQPHRTGLAGRSWFSPSGTAEIFGSAGVDVGTRHVLAAGDSACAYQNSNGV